MFNCLFFKCGKTILPINNSLKRLIVFKDIYLGNFMNKIIKRRKKINNWKINYSSNGRTRRKYNVTLAPVLNNGFFWTFEVLYKI